MEYTINSRYREELRHSRQYYKNKSQELLFSVVVGYAPLDGFMYPNYHSMKNTFRVNDPPKFKVNLVEYSLAKKNFIISFNNNANEKDALKKSNYKLKFKGKELNIDKIVHIDDQVILYPNPKIAISVFEEISNAERTDKEGTAIFNIKIEDIRDIHGNYINEPFYRVVKQYREFFVQRIVTKPGAIPKDSLYMNKNLPLFKGQPISSPGNISDYWMNTPLPNVEE